jgi:serine/threonine-protein kinase HipA
VTSRPGTFVFVQLPGDIAPVVAARYELEATAAGSLGHFVYGRSYLSRPDALPLDPIHLPLSDEEFTTTLMGGMFGALRDTAPDAWGRLILERGQRDRTWTELDYLLGASDQRVGALRYSSESDAPSPGGKPFILADLERLGDAAEVLEGEVAGDSSNIGEEIAQLLDPSSGLGGARPKTSVVDDDGRLWIAKFPSRGDRRVNAISEAAYLGLAGQCGIRVPRHRITDVEGRPTVLVQRFDQEPTPEGDRRRLYLSGHTLLGLDESVSDRRGWSYMDLAHRLRRISDEPEKDVLELFRRMVFNALVTNLDDHPRNHAVVGTASGGWRLSPAFDLVASNAASRENRELAMACGVLPGRERWANRANLLSGCRHFGLASDEANSIINEIKSVVTGSWEQQVLDQGGSGQDCKNLVHAIAYDGFEFGAL